MSEFYSRHLKCKKCCIIKQRAWASKNPEKVKQYFNKFKMENSEAYERQQREYCERNRKLLTDNSNEWKKKNRDKWNKYISNYKKTNPSYHISETLRGRIRNVLLSKNVKKENSTSVLLGCSYDECRAYLESKFKDEMSWENYGFGKNKWHIDHIIPCASFDLTKMEEQLKCFNYTNLQPLWQTENLAKGSKIL
jgi:hypothetical protein